MTPDEYVYSILSKYAVNCAGAEAASQLLYPTLVRWANGNMLEAQFSGSLAKGTAISIDTDADVFISLSSTTPHSLKEIYEILERAVAQAGYVPKKQNVS